MREKIHRDYDGTVLGTEVLPDTPVRGPYGQAFIPFKEGAQPIKARPFVMHWERLTAHYKVIDDWIAHKFIEKNSGGVVAE